MRKTSDEMLHGEMFNPAGEATQLFTQGWDLGESQAAGSLGENHWGSTATTPL